MIVWELRYGILLIGAVWCMLLPPEHDEEPRAAVGGRSERQWCELIAVEEFGCKTIDGKVEGVEVSLFNARRVDLMWGEGLI